MIQPAVAGETQRGSQRTIDFPMPGTSPLSARTTAHRVAIFPTVAPLIPTITGSYTTATTAATSHPARIRTTPSQQPKPNQHPTKTPRTISELKIHGPARKRGLGGVKSLNGGEASLESVSH